MPNFLLTSFSSGTNPIKHVLFSFHVNNSEHFFRSIYTWKTNLLGRCLELELRRHDPYRRELSGVI
jgi:hypothetical protein